MAEHTSKLVNWFTENTATQFQDYNSIMAGIATRKVVGDDKTTNFVSERWISTMIAVEATAVIAFLAIQSAFITVTRTLFQAIQLDFKTSFKTFKEHGKVTSNALKIFISMVPLIIYGALSPKGAYEKIATKLKDDIDTASAALAASGAELTEVKEKLAQELLLEKDDFANLTAEKLAERVTRRLKYLEQQSANRFAQIKTALKIDDASDLERTELKVRELVAEFEGLLKDNQALREGDAGRLQEVTGELDKINEALSEVHGESTLTKLRLVIEGWNQVNELTLAKQELEARIAKLNHHKHSGMEWADKCPGSAQITELTGRIERMGELHRTELEAATNEARKTEEAKALIEDQLRKADKSLEELRGRVSHQEEAIKQKQAMIEANGQAATELEAANRELSENQKALELANAQIAKEQKSVEMLKEQLSALLHGLDTSARYLNIAYDQMLGCQKLHHPLGHIRPSESMSFMTRFFTSDGFEEGTTNYTYERLIAEGGVGEYADAVTSRMLQDFHGQPLQGETLESGKERKAAVMEKYTADGLTDRLGVTICPVPTNIAAVNEGWAEGQNTVRALAVKVQIDEKGNEGLLLIRGLSDHMLFCPMAAKDEHHEQALRDAFNGLPSVSEIFRDKIDFEGDSQRSAIEKVPFDRGPLSTDFSWIGYDSNIIEVTFQESEGLLQKINMQLKPANGEAQFEAVIVKKEEITMYTEEAKGNFCPLMQNAFEQKVVESVLETLKELPEE